MASAYYVQSNPDDQVNRCLASQTGLTLRQVEFLRREFSKHGRNPMPEMLEILAVENGFEENKVKVRDFFFIFLFFFQINYFQFFTPTPVFIFCIYLFSPCSIQFITNLLVVLLISVRLVL
ncbi:hypothetical protein D917_09966 [Trichinella nativa]|uniref:Uncharacterized protein n=1 Tax=Trichinella nativa TaxID=6335 RepID=A0A1Y3EDR8_9BILA|nr:hypothetical protein D917_09966 [Trichinella nativa]